MITEKDEIIKNEILLQAQKLFQQYGLKKTTMDEIAIACGKAKSTLYHYFISKNEVFDAVVEMEVLNLRQHVKDRVEEHKKMLDKIKTYALEFHKEAINKVNLYRIIKQDSIAESYAKKLFFKMMEFEQKYIIRILEDGYDSGEYKEIAREEIPWVAEIFLAAFLGVVQYAIEKDGFLDEEKLERTINLIAPKIFC